MPGMRDIAWERPQLCFALDADDISKNLRLAEETAQVVDILKINDDAVDESGLEAVVTPFLQFGLPIFVDMKMHKGKRTMSARALRAAKLGVALVNAFAEADRLLEGPAEALRGTNTGLLAVTVLTHQTEDFCRRVYRRSVNDTVKMFSNMALNNGADGIILPVPSLKSAGLHLIKATPGIRPLWSQKDANDQELTGTPTEAVLGGSNILICGSPIAKYPDGPAAGAKRIRDEMMEAYLKRMVEDDS